MDTKTHTIIEVPRTLFEDIVKDYSCFVNTIKDEDLVRTAIKNKYEKKISDNIYFRRIFSNKEYIFLEDKGKIFSQRDELKITLNNSNKQNENNLMEKVEKLFTLVNEPNVIKSLGIEQDFELQTNLERVAYLLRYKPVDKQNSLFKSQLHYDFGLFTLIFQNTPGLYFINKGKKEYPNVIKDSLIGIKGIQTLLLNHPKPPTLHGVEYASDSSDYRFSIVLVYTRKDLPPVTKIPPELMPT